MSSVHTPPTIILFPTQLRRANEEGEDATQKGLEQEQGIQEPGVAASTGSTEQVREIPANPNAGGDAPRRAERNEAGEPSAKTPEAQNALPGLQKGNLNKQSPSFTNPKVTNENRPQSLSFEKVVASGGDAQMPGKQVAQTSSPAAAPSQSQPQKAAQRKADNAKGDKLAGPVIAQEDNDPVPGFFRSLYEQSPSWLVSMVLHAFLVVLLATLSMPQLSNQLLEALSISTPSEEDSLEPMLEEFTPETLTAEISTDDVEVTPLVDANTNTEVVSIADDLSAAANDLDVTSLADAQAQRSELFKSVNGIGGSSLEGRGEASRAMLVQRRGGSKESEIAVTRSLEWLARHQMPDGGWNFNHAPLNCGCTGPGEFSEARNAATGIALMPFLGAGQTHREGKFKNTVRGGLTFLVRNMKRTNQGGSFFESQGNMYSQGIASIAICEAYAMTQDRELRAPAEAALLFIVNAQDPVGGGWRYQPREPGDTSVVGWQMMTMKSALLGYLDVPPQAVKGTSFFLDSVQREGGSQYGYVSDRDGGKGTSAIGLLCRMYLGWKRDNPAIKAGIEYLAQQGPDPEDIYYNYYATQVMSHYGGEPWKQWNAKMREDLVSSQATLGDEAGSWLFKDPGHKLGDRGGRLCCTALASMTLEVYYRYLPIYSEESTAQEFKD